MLAVSTISDVKLFTVRRRKGDEKGTLRVTKIDAPMTLAGEGARNVTISPDGRWLCVIRPNNDVYIARVQVSSEADEKFEILPQLSKLKRVSRHTRREKAIHGTLGDYERIIRSVVFSDDSKILATGDLSGCVDTWVLSSAAEAITNGKSKSNGASASDDESSDDEDEGPAIEGERWTNPNPESPIPRMKSGITLLSFRPRSAPSHALTNGHTSTSEDRLMILTSEHQLIEFEACNGKLSDWSRRNPKAYLPAEFRGVKDRAMGCMWDVFEGRERLWLYGTSWLWMFDMQQDFPNPEELESEPASSLKLTKASKRKRDLDEDFNERKKTNSGAGDRIPRSQTDIHLGTKVRKIVGSDESQGEWVSLDPERPRAVGEDDEDYEYDEAFAAGNETHLARLRRGDGNAENEGSHGAEAKAKSTTSGLDDTSNKKMALANGASSQPARRWWHTYKYRDILGIVPLNLPNSSSGEEPENRILEVAVVERPMWDVELPDKYEKEYE